jgi:flagellar biosynthetic protein FlhB
MMAAVPSATVVINNPTHYSVALLWDPASQSTPKVVAKGVDFTALKIREIAKENRVPMVENPVLARSLYDQVDVGDDIPPHHYKAIASIMRFVLNIRPKG